MTFQEKKKADVHQTIVFLMPTLNLVLHTDRSDNQLNKKNNHEGYSC